MINRKQFRINNESKRNLRIESNKIKMKRLLLPECLSAIGSIKRKIDKEYLRLQLENKVLENKNTIEKSIKNKLFRDNIENKRYHANDNNKKNHANDNNKDVGSNVKSKKSRKSSKKSPVNYKIRNDGIYSLPEDERGFSNNKWGGHKPSSITKVKGTFGAASDVRSVSPAVWAQVQKRYP